MNPVCTITVEGNKAVAVGTISVGEKIDVTVVGVSPASIPDYGEESWFGGKSLRLRIVDTQGHDLARFPLKESDSWVVEGDRLSAVNVELNTRQLRNVFSGVAYGDRLQFGLILDSGIDHAQYARGKVNVQQWAVASIDDPKVVPDWTEVLSQLDRDLAEIETSKNEAVNAANKSVEAAGVAGRKALSAEVSALDAVASMNGAVAAKEAAVLASSRYPRIENGRWLVWQNGAWVDNGPAQGPKGDMPSLDGVVKKDDVVPVEIPYGDTIAVIGGKEIKSPKGGGGVPADYDAVRQNASTGAEHAAKTGNPHGTMAADIGAATQNDIANATGPINASLQSLGDALLRHRDDSGIHVTAANKAAWNAKRDKDDRSFDRPVGDGTWDLTPWTAKVPSFPAAKAVLVASQQTGSGKWSPVFCYEGDANRPLALDNRLFDTKAEALAVDSVTANVTPSDYLGIRGTTVRYVKETMPDTLALSSEVLPLSNTSEVRVRTSNRLFFDDRTHRNYFLWDGRQEGFLELHGATCGIELCDGSYINFRHANGGIGLPSTDKLKFGGLPECFDDGKTLTELLGEKRDKSDMFTEWEPDHYDISGQPVKVGDDMSYHYEWDGGNGHIFSTEETSETVLLRARFVCSLPDFGDEFIAARTLILTKSDITTNLSNPPAGKAAEAAAVKTAIEEHSGRVVDLGGGRYEIQGVPKPIEGGFAASQIVSGTLSYDRLPTATPTAKGAVKPVAKTDEMTDSVGIDGEGKLWVKPGGGGGGGGATTGHNLKVTIKPQSGYWSSWSEVGAVVVKSDGTFVSADNFDNTSARHEFNVSDAVACLVMLHNRYGHVEFNGTDINGYGILSADHSDRVTIPITKDTELVLEAEGQCFLAGTLLTLSDGSKKPIEEITYEDELLVWDFDEGRLGSAKPFSISKTCVGSKYWVNRFSDGTVVKTTGTVAGHRFFSADDNMFVYNTECVGKRVIKDDGSVVVLESCDLVHGVCEYYNLYTERHMNCFIGGILGSLHYNNLYAIENMKFVKVPRKLRPIEEFGVPEKWYYGFRLGEQEESVDDIVADVNRRIENENEKGVM